VNVSSKLHELGELSLEDPHFRSRPFSALAAYAQSKLAEVVFTEELRRRLAGGAGGGGAGKEVVLLSLHPGNVVTDVVRTLPAPIRAAYRAIMQFLLLTPAEGCRATLFAATREEAPRLAPFLESGARASPPHPAAHDASLCAQLFLQTTAALPALPKHTQNLLRE